MSSEFSAPLDVAMRRALAHLATLDTAPIGARADTKALRERLHRPVPEQGMPAVTVVDELAADVAGGWHLTNSGRFYPWVIGGALPAALARRSSRGAALRPPWCCRPET